MANKRKYNTRQTILPSKKIKSCYLPLSIRDIILSISHYLEGDDLLNFKLVCKKIEEITRDLKCTIRITFENFERTIEIPGTHIIKLDDKYENLHKMLANYSDKKTKKVTNLIIDYCGKKSGHWQDHFFQAFTHLQTLRIIRCIEVVEVYIPKKTHLSHLEIYTNDRIVLFIEAPIKNVVLCSRRSGDVVAHDIGIVHNNDLSDYVKTIKIHCARIYFNNMDVEGLEKQYCRNDFVPNPLF